MTLFLHLAERTQIVGWRNSCCFRCCCAIWTKCACFCWLICRRRLVGQHLREWPIWAVIKIARVISVRDNSKFEDRRQSNQCVVFTHECAHNDDSIGSASHPVSVSERASAAIKLYGVRHLKLTLNWLGKKAKVELHQSARSFGLWVDSMLNVRSEFLLQSRRGLYGVWRFH